MGHDESRGHRRPRGAAGQYIAIVGASGSGKTTLMNILGCLDSPTGGTCQLSDRDVRGLD